MKDNFKDLKAIKVRGWKSEEPYGQGVTYVQPALIGINCLSRNSNKVQLRYSYNGSSDEAFGGAKQWPVIESHVSFQMDEEAKAQKFAKDLMSFINNWSYDEK